MSAVIAAACNTHGSPSTHQIREVTPDNRNDLAILARLHSQLLDFGPMAKLGELFIREICYRVNLETGRMKAALYEVDGRPVGFIGYTPFSVTFHREALRRRWGYTALILALSLLREPRRLLHLPKVMRVMFSRRGELKLGDKPLGELVAIGVLPAYRSADFVRRAGLRIPEELVIYVSSYFRGVGINRMRGIVDADNKPALLFYHGLGAHFEPYEQAGQPVVHVWFDLDHQLTPAPGSLFETGWRAVLSLFFFIDRCFF